MQGNKPPQENIDSRSERTEAIKVLKQKWVQKNRQTKSSAEGEVRVDPDNSVVKNNSNPILK